ncbi:uncharacterized protein LOC143298198 [Babylonia areolata]|uniref:uncharacterized protein LOC143298198 n=1 Tax=Babylonia areolata TaxID=304850 RepID=UPI003FD1131A
MSLFRCAGDIIFDNVEPMPGQVCNVRLKQFSETCNFLQHLSPLTPEHPYFFAQICALAPKSRITLGIAGPDIAEDACPGHWTNSVGYHSDNGQCYSSHRCVANTEGQKFGIGDIFGVLVTYFGDTSSTVIFLKNGYPVATRYLFEPDHNCFLPTIALEHGPIDLGLMWPEAAMSAPQYSEKNMLHWIKPPGVIFDLEHNMFTYDGKEKEVIIQSPHPLSTEIQHFEVVIQEVSEVGGGPAIALATCSPVFPTSTSPLLKDFLRFFPDGSNCDIKVKVGQRMGWGVHFHKEARSQAKFDPRAQQLVMCYLTLDTQIAHMQVMLQPSGGFFPLVILREWATKVTVDMETHNTPKGMVSFLDSAFDKVYSQHVRQLKDDSLARRVEQSMFRRSDSVEVSMVGSFCRVRLPGTAKGIHVLQFLSPLTPANSYFSCQIRQLSEESTISVGVAGRDLPLNKHPGRIRPSVGWHSRHGTLLRNDRSDGNLAAHRFKRGDLVGVEMEAFATEMSVALFTRNCRPVGTCYYTQRNRDEFLPSIGLCSNGYDIVIDVCWQNMNGGAHNFNVVDLEDWCLPPGAVVNKAKNIVTVPDHIGSAAAIQAPYSLNKGYNHFEIRLLEDFSTEQPPPAIVLSTATPLDPTPVSHFRLDFLRFWAINEASKTVRRGDQVGWGVLYLEEGVHHDEEQLVICYLTVNRKVLLVRVVFQPPGGLYPLVILPSGVNQVQMEFGATIITEHPISEEDVRILVEDAKKMIAEEDEAVAQGKDPHDLQFDGARLFRPLPSAGKPDGDSGSQSKVKDTRVSQTVKTNKMASVVVDLMQNRNGKTNKWKVKPSKVSLAPSDAPSDQTKSRSCAVL